MFLGRFLIFRRNIEVYVKLDYLILTIIELTFGLASMLDFLPTILELGIGQIVQFSSVQARLYVIDE